MPKTLRSGQNKRTRAETRRDRAQIAHLHLQRKTVTEIAEELNLSRATVWRDLNFLEEQWLKDGLLDMQRAKLRQLRELREVRAEAQLAWNKSKEGESEQTSHVLVATNKDGTIKKGAKPSKARVITKKKASVGDAKFLDVIMKTLDQEADLLGVKIKKLELESTETPTGAGGIIWVTGDPIKRPTKENGGMK